MSAKVYVAWFPSKALADQTARTARESVPGTRTVVVSGADREHAVSRALEVAAGRTAARGAFLAVVTVVSVTVLLVVSQMVDTGVSLALGGATAVTAAPFVGGLAGLVVGFGRWNNAPVEALPGHSMEESDTLLLVRTSDPDRLAAVVAPAKVTRPDIQPDPV